VAYAPGLASTSKPGHAMTRIDRLELVPLDFAMPEAKAYGMARGVTSHRQCSLIRLTTADGVVGWGEAWGPCRATEAALDLVLGYVVGRSVFDIELVLAQVLAKHYHFGLQNAVVACLSGIDVAALDAAGRTLGVPVHDLIGGKGRERVPVYASGGYITADPDNQLAAQMERIAGKGHIAVKIKIGLGPRSDAERCRLVREILGEDVLLMVDVNGNYTVDLARESMRRIAPYDVNWYEEPLPPTDVEGLVRLHQGAPIPIATGEALYTVFDFQRVLAGGGVDVVQPDISLVGGLHQAKAVALLCQLHNLRLSPHVWGSAIGLAAGLHLMAATPPWPHTTNEPWPQILEWDVGANPLRDELLLEPIPYAEGTLAVPSGPGLGVEPDPAALARFRLA
jgi:D-galactarolactone cycloisomerase